MSGKIRILNIDSDEEIAAEFRAIGVDPAGFEHMLPKAQHVNIRVRELSAPAALILKQEMLSLGGDCANHRKILKNDVVSADSILMGNVKVFQKLILKLRQQPFGLNELAENLQAAIENYLHPKPMLLKCGSRTLDLSRRTYIMGILNVTPDSFSDGGEFFEPQRAIERGIQMAEQGADIIDVGAESTRPGADPLSQQQELERLIPVVEQLARVIDVPISVDTYKSQIAEAAIAAGATMINDISGLRFDSDMKTIAARYNVPVAVMHIKGVPKNMQLDPDYDDLIDEIYQYLADSIKLAMNAGLNRDQIIIDPGIGFGKRLLDNYTIIKRLREFSTLACPILIGPSRKSFIGKILDAPPDQRLEGTAAAVAIGIQNGANIVRVHDVAAMKRVCQIADMMKESRTESGAAGQNSDSIEKETSIIS